MEVKVQPCTRCKANRQVLMTVTIENNKLTVRVYCGQCHKYSSHEWNITDGLSNK